MKRRLLMVASHFPPCQESTGPVRVMAFSRYLAEHGWEAIVLTMKTSAYARIDPNQASKALSDINVVRTFAFNIAKHFSIFGRYPGWLAFPDRWGSWWLSAVIRGLRLIKRNKPQVIWTTYPPLTSLAVAHTLHRLTKIPLVLDLRDPFPEDNAASKGFYDRITRRIEKAVVRDAVTVCFTTRYAARSYRKHFTEFADSKWAVLPNGFDEEVFSTIDSHVTKPAHNAPLTLLHSGRLYFHGRNPECLLYAFKQLTEERRLPASDVRLHFRASGEEHKYRSLINAQRLSDFVHLLPPLPYREAAAEMMSASGLLILQGRRYNRQVPAKLYEYLRSGRPILALVDSEGETANLMHEIGLSRYIAQIDDSSDICDKLFDFITTIQSEQYPLLTPEELQKHSRRTITARLSEILNAAVSPDTMSGVDRVEYTEK